MAGKRARFGERGNGGRVVSGQVVQRDWHAQPACLGRKTVRVARVCVGVAIASWLLGGVPPQAMAKAADKEEAGRPASAQSSSILPTWYALALGQLQGRLAVAHYWSSDKKFRALTLINGRPLLTIVNGPYYYTIDLAQRKGVRITRNPSSVASDGRYSRPFAQEWEELIAAGGEKVREEKVAGRVTEIWRLTNNSGRRTVWVSKEKPMVPLRVETYDRKTAKEDTVDYVNWQLGLSLADGFFEPPADIELDRFEYADYVTTARQRPVGPAPPLYRELLHGSRHETD
jgi:hypothetical protein